MRWDLLGLKQCKARVYRCSSYDTTRRLVKRPNGGKGAAKNGENGSGGKEGCRKQVSCPGYVAHELSGLLPP